MDYHCIKINGNFPGIKNDGVSPEFSLKNEMGRSILEKSDDLIEICLKFHPKTYKTEWFNVLKEFHELILFVNKREHFSEEMILEFQKLADRYSTSWANLAGRDGQTNYEHFFRSGHFAYYLYLYGNLYKYSQQGFEAMMGKIKCIYEKATSRGGHGAKTRSHILQIVHFLIRNMLWRSGIGQEYFDQKYGNDE